MEKFPLSEAGLAQRASWGLPLVAKKCFKMHMNLWISLVVKLEPNEGGNDYIWW